MRIGLPVLLVAGLLAGCETLFTDISTRIRYAVRDAAVELEASNEQTRTLALSPNHFPEGCLWGDGYRLELRPYDGDRVRQVGSIAVSCQDRGGYGTGLDSERIQVARKMSVVKKGNETLRITLRKTAAGIEIVGLE